MKPSTLLFTALLATALLAPTAVFAAKGEPKSSKADIMAKYDTNKNGKLDPEEIAQLKSDFLANPNGDLKKLDTNHDGKLSDDELKAFTTGKAKGEKKKKT
jgi:Ca2+-binding EF-hand superfamily protein